MPQGERRHGERLEDKRAVLTPAFAQRLEYVGNEGFRTAEVALRFKELNDIRHEWRPGEDSNLRPPGSWVGTRHHLSVVAGALAILTALLCAAEQFEIPQNSRTPTDARFRRLGVQSHNYSTRDFTFLDQLVSLCDRTEWDGHVDVITRPVALKRGIQCSCR